jgi:hypothetical protein
MRYVRGHHRSRCHLRLRRQLARDLCHEVNLFHVAYPCAKESRQVGGDQGRVHVHAKVSVQILQEIAQRQTNALKVPGTGQLDAVPSERQRYALVVDRCGFGQRAITVEYQRFQDAFQNWAKRGPEIDKAYESAAQGIMADERDPAVHWPWAEPSSE